jgi:hypothetical protein
MMKKETAQSNQHGHIYKEYLKKSLKQVFQDVLHKKSLLSKEMQNIAPEAPTPGGTRCGSGIQ